MCMIFQTQYFKRYILLIDQIHYVIAFTFKILGNMSIIIICFPVHKF